MSQGIEALLARMRSAVAARGLDWLAAQVSAAEHPLPLPSDAPGPRRAARRSRPPERLSPENTPRARRRRRSPSRDPPAPAVELPSGSHRRSGRNPVRWPSPVVRTTPLLDAEPGMESRSGAPPTASPPEVPGRGCALLTSDGRCPEQRAGVSRSRRPRMVHSTAQEAGTSQLRSSLPAGAAGSRAARASRGVLNAAGVAGSRRAGRSGGTFPASAEDGADHHAVCDTVAPPSGSRGQVQPTGLDTVYASSSRGGQASPPLRCFR